MNTAEKAEINRMRKKIAREARQRQLARQRIYNKAYTLRKLAAVGASNP